MHMNKQHTLWHGFMASAERFPDRKALVVEGRAVPYGELREIACQIAATIQAHPEYGEVPLTCIFAYRTVTAFAGVLGALLAEMAMSR